VVYALLIGSIAVRRSVPLRRLLKQIFAKVSDPLSGHARGAERGRRRGGRRPAGQTLKTNDEIARGDRAIICGVVPELEWINGSAGA